MENKSQTRGIVKDRVNVHGLIIFFGATVIVGIVGVGLPNTINLVNGLEEDAFYGYFASYAVSAILFWLLVYRTTLTCKRKSYLEAIGRFSQKLCIQLKKSKRRKHK